MAFAFHSELSKMLFHIAVKTKRRQLQHIEWKAEQFRCRFHLREANASLKFNIKFDKTLKDVYNQLLYFKNKKL